MGVQKGKVKYSNKQTKTSLTSNAILKTYTKPLRLKKDIEVDGIIKNLV